MNLHSNVTTIPIAPMIVRGRVITDHLVEVGGRGGDMTFLTPDVHKYLDVLPLGSPAKLADLYTISFADIADYLANLGNHLRIESNPHLQRACELSYLTAPTTKPLVDMAFGTIWQPFERDRIYELAESTVGIAHLEGWVERDILTGARVAVRCFGARALHMVAGNSPLISASAVIRNAILRGDAIIKAPSNDPFSALAIAQTMVDIAPDHPLTRHLTVAYWRGGDTALEEKLYQPHNLEKIIAWGGYSSMKHVTRYIQPGLELISHDPKRSVSIVGAEAFESEERMREAAIRLATDIGACNQNACVSSRVSYHMCGTDDAGVTKLNQFGQYVYEAMLALPESTSTSPKRYDRDLKEHVDTTRLSDDWFNVIGGKQGEGAIIVSQIPEPVDFSTLLIDRTANLVPVDSLDEVTAAVNAYTQTVGIYPESLKQKLVDILPLYGAQRFVSLGYAANTTGTGVVPQDGIESVRRLGKWIVNESSTPEMVRPMWQPLPTVDG